MIIVLENFINYFLNNIIAFLALIITGIQAYKTLIKKADLNYTINPYLDFQYDEKKLEKEE
ncbi:MAG: hypothetical protein ACOCUI_05330 [bacterium]